MALAVMVSMVAMYWSGLRLIRFRDRADLDQNFLRQIEILLSTLKDVETGQRGFIITGEEPYLEPYNIAKSGLQGQIDRLRELKNVAVSTRDLDEIEGVVRAKMDELGETIALRRSGGFEAAAARVREGIGKELMDDLRARIGVIRDQQDSLLQKEGREINSATRFRTFVFLTCGLFSLVFIVWAYRRIKLALAETMAERKEVARQKDLLAVTLSSIGDCVIVTDASARITFMNTVAESLTGWKLKEADGRPIGEVFRIINEETRAPVESPVEKVLSSGAVAGLANHTLLIRRDGSEVPIDDSGAPIREADDTTSFVR
jgi:PAS domain S-box-containing protein